MRFTIVEHMGPKRIESHSSLIEAVRACVILNAHEYKNGRGLPYEIENHRGQRIVPSAEERQKYWPAWAGVAP